MQSSILNAMSNSLRSPADDKFPNLPNCSTGNFAAQSQKHYYCLSAKSSVPLEAIVITLMHDAHHCICLRTAAYSMRMMDRLHGYSFSSLRGKIGEHCGPCKITGASANHFFPGRK